MRVTIASSPDRDRVYAELDYCGEHWADVIQEHGFLELIAYPKLSGEPWTFPLEMVTRALILARDRLEGRVP
jgi:hypothetical protein